ncbi:MAG: helix-hairpin-helix domain-containing protein [Acidobacteria bacterium]|nr:helix-hairpin-helix domain-containing protein [Acidobacteriota bacterium]
MVRRTVPLIALIVVWTVTSLAATPTASHGVVNINTATTEQLVLLPRVGPALAQRIVTFRTANGKFKSVDELVAVRGIGEKSFRNLKPYLTTTGPTTLKTKVRLSRRATKASAKPAN